MKQHIAVLMLVLMLPLALFAQRRGVADARTDFSSKSYIDSGATMVWTGVNMSGYLPVGYLHEWFKPNLSVGTGVTVKTASNWTFDVNFHYMFGSNLRDTTSELFVPDALDVTVHFNTLDCVRTSPISFIFNFNAA